MKYNLISDNELWLCCQQDDMKAYDELYNRFWEKLYKLGMRYVKDQFVAEELTGDLLFSMWEKRSLLQVDNLSSYLFKAMHYKCIDTFRKASLSCVPLDQNHEGILDTTGADHILLTEEAEAVYRQRLSQLSSQRSKVFELSREYQMSYSEIAKEMNISVSTVEKHMVAALSFLRKEYNEGALFTAFIILSCYS